MVTGIKEPKVHEVVGIPWMQEIIVSRGLEVLLPNGMMGGMEDPWIQAALNGVQGIFGIIPLTVFLTGVDQGAGNRHQPALLIASVKNRSTCVESPLQVRQDPHPKISQTTHLHARTV